MSRLLRWSRSVSWRAFRRARWLRLALLTLTAGCVVAKPYVVTGRLPTGAQGDTVVVVTHAVLDNDERVPFDAYVDKLSDAMEANRYEGLLGYSIRKVLFGDEVWTLTVWRDEAALRGFMSSGLHREAISSAPRAVVSLRSHHFKWPSTEGPVSWGEALARLEQATPRVAQ